MPRLPVPPRKSQPTVSQTPSSHNKLHQLDRRTDLDRFLKFHGECEGNVISKTAFRLGATRGGERIRQWTSHAQRRDIARYQAIRYAPVIFQEAVAKKIELRVTVVGGKVMAAAIHSQQDSRRAGDWRHYPELDTARHYSVWQLPAEIEQRCLDVTAALGLCYGAIDLILTPEGEYVFLEINPHGQWEFIETATGLPISDAIADLLHRGKA